MIMTAQKHFQSLERDPSLFLRLRSISKSLIIFKLVRPFDSGIKSLMGLGSLIPNEIRSFSYQSHHSYYSSYIWELIIKLLSILPAPRGPPPPRLFASPMIVVLKHFCFYKSSRAQYIVVVLAFLRLRKQVFLASFFYLCRKW